MKVRATRTPSSTAKSTPWTAFEAGAAGRGKTGWTPAATSPAARAGVERGGGGRPGAGRKGPEGGAGVGAGRRGSGCLHKDGLTPERRCPPLLRWYERYGRPVLRVGGHTSGLRTS